VAISPPAIEGKRDGRPAFGQEGAHHVGRASAIAFAAEGAEVIATDVAEEKLAGIEGVKKRRLDVTDGRAVEGLAKELGAIDVLFNVAGWVQHGSILECPEEDWDRSFDINVKSMYRTCKAFLPAMLEKGGGSIINMSSGASSVRGIPNRFAYGATKAAAIAADFIKRGIRANAICPGTIETPSLGERIAAQGGTAAVRQAFIDRQPMGRLGRAEEIAAIAVYLASDESSFTTGQIHIVDGGFSL
jgi:2-keto-3-deoxy-L-fuconate dehydrogenase